jgi:SAM-dependent methyltransferase
MQRVDYDKLAPTYHSRYAGPTKLEGIAQALVDLASRIQAKVALEVGCGTARFVEDLRKVVHGVYGCDASTGMLGQAARRLGPEQLIAAHANHLPFAPESFDLITCINAIHHFDNADAFVRDASRLLRPGGVLAVVGMDPRVVRHRYYYDYFEGSYDIDMRRYASFGHWVDTFTEAGLDQVELRIVETPSVTFVGPEILSDPFLVKESNSLLTLLSNDVYQSGLRRIEDDAAAGKTFRAELPFALITGFRSPIASAKGTT